MYSSRRRFLKAGALTSAALAADATLGQANSVAEDKGAPDSGYLKIKMAGYDYDRVKGLMDGRVQIEGCETQFEVARIGEMNTHVFSGPQTRRVTEIGLLPFVLAYANEEFRDYTLIPVFPLRVFRHKSIFIRTDRGITKPDDLRGRKIATPGYSSTSLTWVRGIMQHEYGVKPEEIHWVVSSTDSSAKDSGGASRLENVLPKGISIRTGPKGKDESDLLVDGDVDALFHAAEPRQGCACIFACPLLCTYDSSVVVCNGYDTNAIEIPTYLTSFAKNIQTPFVWPRILRIIYSPTFLGFFVDRMR